ncbi:MAG: radical SAM protein [Clostridia bacterium]|nr:radical SAM protein [Clostridia bacterium]
MTPTYDGCTLCPRACGVDRTAGGRGACGQSATLRVARASLHRWEEPPLSGTRGSGTVFFSGCPLRCLYCQNAAISHGGAGVPVTVEQLTETYLRLADAGAHNINLVTATHFLPDVLRSVREAKKRGVALPFVWNTSGYETVETVRTLVETDTVQIFLTDFRYTRADTAAALSAAPDYPAVARAALREMVQGVGAPVFDDRGLMRRGVIVRLLLLPGHLLEAKQALRELWRAYGDAVCLSLMSQYTPRPDLPAPLDRRVTEAEYRSFVCEAQTLGVTCAYTQEREAAAESYIPPFFDTGLLVCDPPKAAATT